ncbi:MAG: ArsR family transcriptional regulator [Bacteroidales bacterium]|nr:ArsR family transcriptional regulator [Bacteroidales bacterium]
MLQTLITSKTRLRLLLKFFLNSNTTSWLRDMESEFGESTNAIRSELMRLEDAGMLTSMVSGNKKMYRANTNHPLFGDIHQLLLKHTGIDQVIERIVNKIGGMTETYLIGAFAKGIDSPVIDILMVGNGIDRVYLLHLIEKAELFIQRKIRYVIVSPEEKEGYMTECPEAFLLWEKIQ